MIGPRQITDALIAVERERKPIVPFSDAYPFLDIGRAYEAQRLFVEDHVGGGDQPIAAKLACSCRVVPITDITMELPEDDHLRQVSPFRLSSARYVETEKGSSRWA
jgi:hypothetical protein